MRISDLFRAHIGSPAGCVALGVALAGCNQTEAIPSRVGLLTAHRWRLDALTSTPAHPVVIGGQTQYFTDMFAQYRAQGNQCLLDEHLTFALGDYFNNYGFGAYHYQGGQPGCVPQYQTTDWNWFMEDINGKTQIYLQDGGSMPYNGVIKSTLIVRELTSERLLFTSLITESAGSRTNTYTFSYTLSAE